ncbi:MAG: glycosyltransferase family 39 protein [Actinobacteria bacterium]|nr:glycosyltransferase family 39 protein [Actinomycetota bacterium]
MFEIAFLVGIYSYIIFALGLSGLLFKEVIIISSAAFWLIAVVYYRKKIIEVLKLIPNLKIIKKDKLLLISSILLFLQILLNFIIVFTPEISFDALWYHLTLPKLYLQNNSIFYIPGNLLYYSVMPKLADLLFIPALAISGDMAAKLVQFSFGILSLAVIYKIARRFMTASFALLAVLIFYSNLVVAWESSAAYIDLIRTFFEGIAFLGFLKWLKTNKFQWLIESALLIGFSISIKLLALSSVLVFICLLILITIQNKKSIVFFLKNSALFIFLSLLVPLPWFIFSYLNIGNPIYPYFSNLIGFNNFSIITGFNLAYAVRQIWILFTQSQDPVSPIYLIILPLIIVYFKKLKIEGKIMAVYITAALFIWVISETIGESVPAIAGGSRYYLPYLAVFSVLCAYAISVVKNINIRKLSIIMVFLIAFISIGYRGEANKRYYQFLLGKETRSEFLAKNLNFSYGDFYDIDGYFARTIKKDQKALLYGFHNLYYVDFPFVDFSWVKKGDNFNYVVVQNTDVPERFKNWNLIYENKRTNIMVYSLGGLEWIY